MNKQSTIAMLVAFCLSVSSPSYSEKLSAKPTPKPPAPNNNLATNREDPNVKAYKVTSCTGVDACNKLIAKCAKKNGHMAPTSFDGETGAPNGGYCRNHD